jgi:hypothetical protein
MNESWQVDIIKIGYTSLESQYQIWEKEPRVQEKHSVFLQRLYLIFIWPLCGLHLDTATQRVYQVVDPS